VRTSRWDLVASAIGYAALLEEGAFGTSDDRRSAAAGPQTHTILPW